jgi:hypothetical protein
LLQERVLEPTLLSWNQTRTPGVQEVVVPTCPAPLILQTTIRLQQQVVVEEPSWEEVVVRQMVEQVDRLQSPTNQLEEPLVEPQMEESQV